MASGMFSRTSSAPSTSGRFVYSHLLLFAALSLLCTVYYTMRQKELKTSRFVLMLTLSMILPALLVPLAPWRLYLYFSAAVLSNVTHPLPLTIPPLPSSPLLLLPSSFHLRCRQQTAAHRAVSRVTMLTTNCVECCAATQLIVNAGFGRRLCWAGLWRLTRRMPVKKKPWQHDRDSCSIRQVVGEDVVASTDVSAL